MVPDVIERQDVVNGIEVFIVFALAAFDLAVVPWGEGLNAFVLNTRPIQR